MTPADADLALLETARRCDFYGCKLQQAKVNSFGILLVIPILQDIEGTDVALSVAHMGNIAQFFI